MPLIIILFAGIAALILVAKITFKILRIFLMLAVIAVVAVMVMTNLPF